MDISVEQIECREWVKENLLSVKDLIIRLRRKLKDVIINFQRCPMASDRQCPPSYIAFFLMMDKTSRFSDHISQDVKSHLEKSCKTTMKSIEWMDGDILKDQQSLWRIYIGREINKAPLVYEEQLSNFFRTIVREPTNSHVLCLMLWLFPELRTVDRIDAVVRFEMNGLATWMLQDKMLLWGAQIRSMDCSQEKVRDIEAKIFKRQLNSGGFANIEGQDAHADLISSACALLTLVSCAGRGGLEDAAFVPVHKTARWVFEQLSKTQDVNESFVWALYSLSEFVNLYRREG